VCVCVDFENHNIYIDIYAETDTYVYAHCVYMHINTQATEPIVDLALQHRKPFAVVPCCVFPDSNQHRKNPDGTMVRYTMVCLSVNAHFWLFL
jgi:hypothetical protein